jgi:uncharacterized protein YjaZ
MRMQIAEAGGFYSYWETGRKVSLREHLVNEGLAVNTSRAVSPGHAAWEYFGYERKQYGRIRELEPVVRQAALAEGDDARGLGLRLKYLSDGVSEVTRTVNRSVLPERSGYYLGARMVEQAIEARGLEWAVRASAQEIDALGNAAAATA